MAAEVIWLGEPQPAHFLGYETPCIGLLKGI